MKERADHLKAMGLTTKYHSYTGLRYGFGLGICTIAEGCINQAINFWKKIPNCFFALLSEKIKNKISLMFKKYILFNKIFNLNKIHNYDYANHDYVKYLCIYILINFNLTYIYKIYKL